MNVMIPNKPIEQIVERTLSVLDDATIQKAQTIVSSVREQGEMAVYDYAKQFGELSSSEESLVLNRDELKAALSVISNDDRSLLERVAGRVTEFACSQRATLSELTYKIQGGLAGQVISPIMIAGCYAPGGRYPLPSTVLMTVCTAKAAGVGHVVVASPRPHPITLAAAAIAGADSFIRVGGAHAIAAMAFGVGAIPKCDIIVGPGNRWVTAAKYIVSRSVGIDMIAGPSELVVVADSSADAKKVAADLIAQAEHDEDALVVLISLDENLIVDVRKELDEQLKNLATSATARIALERGASFAVRTINEAAEIVNKVAPEHLQLSVKKAEHQLKLFSHYGAAFLGEDSAEVLCDYGAGPNHVLPTSQSSRHTGGLSVFTFCRIRTWLQVNDAVAARELAKDAAALAACEGLEGHALAGLLRTK